VASVTTVLKSLPEFRLNLLEMSEPSWLLVGHRLKGSKYLESVRNLLDSWNFFYFEGTIGDWGANNNYHVTP